MFNVIKFYKDYRIPVTNSGKHVRKGWINTDCPFCRGKNGHLGVHISTGAIKCWKCGTHSENEVVQAFLNCDWDYAKEIIEQYPTDRNTKLAKETKRTYKETVNNVCTWPSGTTELNDAHKAYLEGRGFDANLLEKVWNLRGTGHIGDYKFRIIAPIIFNGVMVSYQGRDYTGKAELRYKACKQVDEIIPHQKLVYGMDLVKGGTCVIVEGIADAWRFGPGAVCCFGTAFTLAQVNLLANRFNVCYILFDADDNNAIKMADELAALLAGRGVEVEIIDISDTPDNALVDPKKGIDPGNLQQWYADQIMEELQLEGYLKCK